jgi:hypothetical protein
MEEKKQWSKPALVVLVRSKPEEAVLQACKTSGSGANGRDCEAGGCPSSASSPS